MIGQEPQLPFKKIDQKIEKNSDELQSDYLNLAEQSLQRMRNEECSYEKKLTGDERELVPIFDDPSKPPSYIDRVRGLLDNSEDSAEKQRASEKVWVVIDFDDVINKTTTYNNFLRDQICESTGLDKKEFEKLYEASKIVNDENKKVLRFNNLVEKIEEYKPGEKEFIDGLITVGVNPNEFIDQGMKRVLLALGRNTTEKREIRISILTFGDINYQKGRIDRTDMSDAVDDIIYTEGSKREVLEALLEKDYKSRGIIPPTVITLDDSKEQIKDYYDINLPNNFINMHYKNPQGKKSMEDSAVEQVIAVKEKERNEAALDFYRICKICLNPGMRLSRKELHEEFDDKNISDIYKNTAVKSDIKRRKASRIDSTGRLNYIVFGDSKHLKEDPEMNRVIDADGLTAWDYYMSLNDPTYPVHQQNIKYFQGADGNIIRSYDVHRLEKGENNNLETRMVHKETPVTIEGVPFTPLIDVEEFIKNAK
ncbi:MAG: hypothetical protein WCT50_03755 [Patescibacteria group bacterium]